jgi:hypothetical protein
MPRNRRASSQTARRVGIGGMVSEDLTPSVPLSHHPTTIRERGNEPR